MFHVFKTAHFQFETVDLEMHFSMVLFSHWKIGKLWVSIQLQMMGVFTVT